MLQSAPTTATHALSPTSIRSASSPAVCPNMPSEALTEAVKVSFTANSYLLMIQTIWELFTCLNIREYRSL